MDGCALKYGECIWSTGLLTIVIGFRNWGLDRLAASLAAHKRKAPNLKIIVVDFGSADAEPVKQCVLKNEASYLRVDAPLWSRAQALNAGVQAAETPFVLVSDADIIFASGVYDACIDALKRDPLSCIISQCWDLPAGIDCEQSAILSDRELTALGSVRPRWGMGGCCAFRKDFWEHIRGFDNRLLVWGGEDNDFVNRLRSIGVVPRWLDNENQRIFHIHHLPVRDVSDGIDYPRINREIVSRDQSYFRNLECDNDERFSLNSSRGAASITVVIATRNRAQLLGPCIESVANQTLTPGKVIVVDDGSDDDTQAVVTKNYRNLEIEYVRTGRVGIAAARNRATALTETKYVCVMDDDDLMMPNCLSDHLRNIRANVHISHGGWIDFDTKASRIALNPGKAVDAAMLFYSGKAMVHCSTMYETSLLREMPYAECFKAGVDYDLNTRLIVAGAKAAHTRTYLLLRRLHSSNVTSLLSPGQKDASLAKMRLHEVSASDEFIGRRQEAKARGYVAMAEPSILELSRLIGFTPSFIVRPAQQAQPVGPAPTNPAELATATKKGTKQKRQAKPSALTRLKATIRQGLPTPLLNAIRSVRKP
jgi:glycosyltransferase involved in cell wall biosynthesis